MPIKSEQFFFYLNTCGEEAVRRQKKLRRDLHFHLVLREFENGEVLLLSLVMRNATLGAIVG